MAASADFPHENDHAAHEQAADERRAMERFAASLSDFQVEYEMDGDVFTFIEGGESAPLFVSVRITSDGRDEVEVRVLVESLEIDRLGKIGLHIGLLGEVFDDAYLDRLDSGHTAAVNAYAESTFNPATVVDWLGYLLDHFSIVLEGMILAGTTLWFEDALRTEGFAELAAAEAFDANQQPLEAVEAAYASLAAFELAQLEPWSTLLRAAVAEALLQADRVTESLNELEVAWRQALDLETEWPDGVPRVLSVRIRALQRSGRLAEADQLLDVLQAHPHYDGDNPTFAHVKESIVASDVGQGHGNLAIEFYEEKLRELGVGGPPRAKAIAYQQLGQGHLQLRQLREAEEALRASVSYFLSAGLTSDAAESEMLIATALCLTSARYDEACDLFDRALPILETQPTASSIRVISGAAAALGRAVPESAVTFSAEQSGSDAPTLINRITRSFLDGDYDTTRRLLQAAESAIAQQAPEYGELQAAVDHISASMLVMDAARNGEIPPQADLEHSLSRVLRSVEFLDTQRRNLAEADALDAWVDYYGRVYANALMTASLAEKHEVAIEIIELVKTQGLQDRMDALDQTLVSQAELSSTALRLLAALGGRVPVTPLHAALSTPSAISFGDQIPLDLRKAVVDQAGAAAWYWSQWKWGPVLFWGAIAPDGRAWSGFVPVGGRDLPPNHSAWTLEHDVSDDALRFTRHHHGIELLDPTEERRLAESLGERLMPPPLQTALAGSSSNAPIELLMAPNEPAAGFPTGLLAAGGRRLIECARMKLAAPVAATTRSPAPTNTTRLTAIIDPLSDFDVFADMRTGNDGTAMGSFWRCAAERGSLLFVGHAEGHTGHSRGPGIQLGHEHNRSVGVLDLIEHGQLGVPHQAVLAACSTAEETDPGSNQLWGLPAVLLGLGAEQIVATRTDIEADETVRRIVNDLHWALQHDESIGDTLRRTQLELLEAHRESSGGLSPSNQWATWVLYGFAETGKGGERG